VRPLLAARGCQVFTPSLTGIGERSHLTHPGIDLSTHIRDVVNTVLYEDLHDIVLLGFSYGGMVVTGALGHIGDQVSHLVYLDAFVPGDGQSVSGIVSGSEPDGVAELGMDWLIPPLPRQLDDPEAQEWSDARRTHQPARTFTEPVRLSRPLEDWPFTRTFIKATADPAEDPGSAFWQAAARARASSDWTYHEIPTHHLVPSTHPGELADLLATVGQA
jgi:pimeloyl-ACP methyl ester carboxylesterase